MSTAAHPKTRKKSLQPQEEAHIVYKDPARQAEMAGLRYATDQGPGLTRKPTRAGHFTYHDAKGQKVSDPKTLDRIASFVIPSAWTQVWISPSATTHLQVTSHDTLGRKQYQLPPGLGRSAQPHQVLAPAHLRRKAGAVARAAQQRPAPRRPRP
ncbi:hypothetical protein [Hymenobacter siberiensis]|uniref:hypothetical protein n=1 Tax=Hymenobacter siberiensis TaxID=2848396 RepID=UPI001D0309DB|nr:hypothetical protein [Hymenobacter siberiensis]